AVFQLLDLRFERRRVAGVAGKDLDRDRATVLAADQAKLDLQLVGPAIAAVAVASQRTAAAFEISRGQVVEDQRPFGEMLAGKLALDPFLLSTEPIERFVDLIGGDAAEAEGRAQPSAGRVLIERTGGGEFGGRLDQPGYDQRDDEIALALCTGDETIELDAASNGERRGDVTVGQRADDFETVAGQHQLVAAQQRAQRLHFLLWPTAEIGERAVLDLFAVAIALAQQHRRRRITIANGGEVHGASNSAVSRANYMTTNRNQNSTFPLQSQSLHSEIGGKVPSSGEFGV